MAVIYVRLDLGSGDFSSRGGSNVFAFIGSEEGLRVNVWKDICERTNCWRRNGVSNRY